ncbi:MAG: hypothetical protein M3Q44_05230 [bacterium]|nr:hypothetical protein [bacterium]
MSVDTSWQSEPTPEPSPRNQNLNQRRRRLFPRIVGAVGTLGLAMALWYPLPDNGRVHDEEWCRLKWGGALTVLKSGDPFSRRCLVDMGNGDMAERSISEIDAARAQFDRFVSVRPVGGHWEAFRDFSWKNLKSNF